MKWMMVALAMTLAGVCEGAEAVGVDLASTETLVIFRETVRGDEKGFGVGYAEGVVACAASDGTKVAMLVEAIGWLAANPRALDWEVIWEGMSDLKRGIAVVAADGLLARDESALEGEAERVRGRREKL